MNKKKTKNNDSQASEEHKICVLVVDDQPMVAEAIRRMLAEEVDIEFHYCQDPSRAVAKANEIGPTIILQDLVMPDVDGYTLLRFYRANEKTANVPVIVLSTKEEPKAKSEAFANGASDYLVKLPDRIEMVARIRAYSRSYMAQLERDMAYRELQDLQKKLEESNRKLEESNKILHGLSVLDGLTGISNRRHFDEMLEQEWGRAVRDCKNISLILLDIDYFKKFNDNYGHQMGDECLQQVANCLSRSLKRTSDALARYGGEEFVVILPDTDAAGAVTIAEKLRSCIDTMNLTHEYSGVSDHVTISLGVATMSPNHGMQSKELVSKADEALYAAKKNGRNRYMTAE
ncbi:MAG: diguanylate cyclase response regulator [Gammaproteobacteria bacterium RBG_16_57_12]|nr:MAG: diguanylate cyclase response regulator [Gammaproteobacteria bacterium RBG_16_57_12]